MTPATLDPQYPDYDDSTQVIDFSALCLPTRPLEDYDDEDDVPLSLATRRARASNNAELILPQIHVAEPLPAVRLREGSEGYEVRPTMRGSSQFDSVADWDGLVDDEGELNIEGDTVRRGDAGDRYRRYEAEMDSESSGSNDSMDNYLDDV